MATLLFVFSVEAQSAALHFYSGCFYFIKEKQQNKKERKQSSQNKKIARVCKVPFQCVL